MRRMIVLLMVLAMHAPATVAAELRVLSAGAVVPGLEAAVAAFRRASGQAVTIAYATAPQLRERLGRGEAPDLVVLPEALRRELAAAGQLEGEPVPLGRVGIGIVTRADSTSPGIVDDASLALAVRQARTVVFNRASTGLHMERLFERLGLGDAVTAKAVRTATGAEVLDHLRRGSDADLGFAAITEILLVPTVRYHGPLPPGLQNHTAHAASRLPKSTAEAAPLLAHLAGPAGRAAFTAAGIEPPP